MCTLACILETLSGLGLPVPSTTGFTGLMVPQGVPVRPSVQCPLAASPHPTDLLPGTWYSPLCRAGAKGALGASPTMWAVGALSPHPGHCPGPAPDSSTEAGVLPVHTRLLLTGGGRGQASLSPVANWLLLLQADPPTPRGGGSYTGSTKPCLRGPTPSRVDGEPGPRVKASASSLSPPSPRMKGPQDPSCPCPTGPTLPYPDQLWEASPPTHTPDFTVLSSASSLHRPFASLLPAPQRCLPQAGLEAGALHHPP